MQCDVNVGFVLFLNQALDPAFDLVDDQYAGPYFSRASASRAFLKDFDSPFRPDSLPCDLHKPEFAWRKDGMLGMVFCHFILQFLE